MRRPRPASLLVAATTIALLAAGLVYAEQAPPHGADHPTSVEKKAESPYTLREVMQHLGVATQELQTGLLMNNRLMIERGALGVADHPAPKGGIKPYIKKSTQGLEATIKQMDKQVHDTAVEIAAKAPKAKMLELAELNQRMVTGCIGCHDAFRD